MKWSGLRLFRKTLDKVLTPFIDDKHHSPKKTEVGSVFPANCARTRGFRLESKLRSRGFAGKARLEGYRVRFADVSPHIRLHKKENRDGGHNRDYPPGNGIRPEGHHIVTAQACDCRVDAPGRRKEPENPNQRRLVCDFSRATFRTRGRVKRQFLSVDSREGRTS